MFSHADNSNPSVRTRSGMPSCTKNQPHAPPHIGDALSQATTRQLGVDWVIDLSINPVGIDDLGHLVD